MSKQRRRNGLGTVLSIGALAGLLIWTKLRLVSDLPRSAYAVPHEVAHDDGGDAADHEAGSESGSESGPEAGAEAGRAPAGASREGGDAFSD